MTMEFEELRRIWDSQNNKSLYVIDEQALHNRIMSKKKQARHITNISELLIIIVNLGSGSFALAVNLFNQHSNMYLYILSAWMFITAFYLIISRVRRVAANKLFDRSMRGDLQHAISVATYQVRLSQMMRWNILPMGGLTAMIVYAGGKSIGVAVAFMAAFAIAFYLSRWEHNIYENKKRELEILQHKLNVES
ncbi:MAG: hypothetical protein ABI663_20745 [Chryseolinea sp.]